MTLISVEHLSKEILTGSEKVVILERLSFQIEKGEQVAIVGRSGSGKSTLLSLLAGFDQLTNGKIWFDGLDWLSLSEDERALERARNIGFVFQHFQLLPMLTALENVMLPLEILQEPHPKVQALEVLEQVGLSHRLNHYPPQLSGGEQQRVALARAFVIKPMLLLADEPTGSLDAANGQSVMDLMFAMNTQWHSTLVLVTHDQALAQRCQKIIHLEAGHIVT